MRYPVTIRPDDGQYTVTFPDVPEAVTFGETRQEALARAADALLTVFDAFMKDRRPIPEPSVRSGVCVELPALDSAKIELYRAMQIAKVGKSELAKRLDWHLPQVDRVLKIKHGSQIEQMEAAFAVLGKRLIIEIKDEQAASGSHHQRPSVVAAKGRRKTSGPGHVHPGVIMDSQRSARQPAGTSHASTVRRSVARRAAKKR